MRKYIDDINEMYELVILPIKCMFKNKHQNWTESLGDYK